MQYVVTAQRGQRAVLQYVMLCDMPQQDHEPVCDDDLLCYVLLCDVMLCDDLMLCDVM